jgi:hypothetical protein
MLLIYCSRLEYPTFCQINILTDAKRLYSSSKELFLSVVKQMTLMSAMIIDKLDRIYIIKIH